ncbi:MAG: polyprenyl synthetase family protein [Bacteroidetes bacterium]|nr:MAG: polyprenyl synthetase family protein [Bacteroidota bacterium]
MSSLDLIKSPIIEELKRFEPVFKSSMKSNKKLLNIIINYIIKSKGKQLRPTIVFLTAKMLGEINKSTHHAAALIELMHTATLVHDDVVDEANKRRGVFSINALWKNKVSVLVGDYLLAKGLLLAVDNDEFDLLRIVSLSVKDMSEGELLQIEKSRKLNINEETYFEIIRKKTASLISSCAAIGAKSVGADSETVEKLSLFGENLGIAFQIKDDIFDYQNNKIIGKPTGNDLKEQKLTLPVIYALEKATNSEKRKIISIIKNHNKEPKKVKHVIDFAIKNNGLEYSTKKMIDYKNKAIQILNEFPDNEAKTALINLSEFVTERKK